MVKYPLPKEEHKAKVEAFQAEVTDTILTRVRAGKIEAAKRLLKLKTQWNECVFREMVYKAKKQLGIDLIE